MSLAKTLSFFSRVYFIFPTLLFLLIYYQSIFFDSVWGDNSILITPAARDFRLMLKSFYDTSFFQGGVHYFPLFYLQCFLVNKVFGNNAFPFGFHLYQYFLQALVCILSTFLFYRITKSKFLSVVIVSLYVIHPINVQNFTRILNAPGMICSTLFCLMFFLSYLEVENRHLLIKSKISFICIGCLFYFLSLLCMEGALLSPVILIWIIFCLKGKEVFMRKYGYLYLPFVVIFPVYLVMRFIASGGDIVQPGNELFTWTQTGLIKDILFRAIWLLPQLVVHYFKLFFFPFGLSDSLAEWYTVGKSLFDPYTLFCQLIVFVLLVMIFVLRKKSLLFSIGMFWFCTSLILVIQIIPLFSIVALRYMYFPLFGLLLAVIGIFHSVIRYKISYFVLILVLSFLLPRTIYYLPSYSNKLFYSVLNAREAPVFNKTFWLNEVLDAADKEQKFNEIPPWITDKYLNIEFQKLLNLFIDLKPDFSLKYSPIQMPYNFYVFRYIYDYYLYKKDFRQLEKIISYSLLIRSDWLALHEITRYLIAERNWDFAWKAYVNAVESNPKVNFIYDPGFIDVALKINKFSEAENIIQQFLRLNPHHSYPFLFAGMFYERFGRNEDAKGYFIQALDKSKRPTLGNDFYYKQAYNFFIRQGMIREAISTLNIVLSYNPFNDEVKSKLNETLKLLSKKGIS